MRFDIIDITEDRLKELSVVQMKMLRTAQQKKDELVRKFEKELNMFRAVVFTSGMKNSTLIEDKDRELRDELGYQTALLADNLIYNMSLNEPSNGGDIGGDGGDEGIEGGNGTGNGAGGGKYDPDNQIIDGNTHYEDELNAYLETLKEMLENNKELTDADKEFIEKYFGGL